MGRIAGRFARMEPRRRVRNLVRGLLSDLPRKNCWSIAEWAGEASPHGMQHLLGRARWDADRVRDDVREYVLEHLHDEDAVLMVDETGDVKKGTHTVGVQRQYTGTAGRIENAQVAVYLVYAGRRGHATVDRELYLPHPWTCDPDRCRAAGLGEDTAFATDLTEPRPGSHRLLIRRNRTTGELACYRCFSPTPAPLATLVRVAGSRWRVEETFQAGKGLAGLDEHQLRRFTSWSRWVTLAMLAHAFLAVVRADEHARHLVPDGLVPFTCNEIQRLFTTLVVRPVHDVAHRLAWRRRHQARAQASHYRRQAANQT
ncbi:IS701 family transposase [Streptomyces sp. NPDC056628]|uniref:IS701 family transposase n=1 Tax=Streptomyces sp. NPDC056628 TaxID=3345882 RepID=UPI003692F49A